MFNDKAESPITSIPLLIVTFIIAMGVFFVLFLFMDGFTNAINRVPLGLSPWAQNNMGKLIGTGNGVSLASIVFVLPIWFTIISIVWAIKTVLRRVGYTRTGGVNDYGVDDY